MSHLSSTTDVGALFGHSFDANPMGPLLPTPPSHREISDTDIRAAKTVVADYLRDLGLTDPDFIASESKRIVNHSLESLANDPKANGKRLRKMAIRQTVKKLAKWVHAIEVEHSAGGTPLPPGVIGAHLPELLSLHPQGLVDESLPERFVATAQTKRKPVVPKPVPKEMIKQKLPLLPRWGKQFAETIGLSRRTKTRAPESPKAETQHGCSMVSCFSATRGLLAFLTLLTTAAAAAAYWETVSATGLFQYPLVGLFVLLFFWIAFSFWTATMGLASILLTKRQKKSIPADDPDYLTGLPRSAILMPIYNEDTSSVMANLKAVALSLKSIGAAEKFDLFILSDTTNPDVWLEEERAWAKLVIELPEQCRVYYRHRAKNTSRKAGNIADFCQRWGEHYPYMTVLDADSVMSGETLVEMVRRMENDPKIGILQVPPTPVNRQSLFARTQQFAAQVYGRVFLEGFALWSECDGNYWGHNAIIRIKPFMEHCDLPVLPGNGPLGGEILSHDFVEAALMRRAGWKICLAHDLQGSYEECPTTMLDYAQRDQRWCQGNMQHMGLLLADGFHPASRLHLSMGVMSYLSSPLWLVFLTLSLIAAYLGGDATAAGINPWLAGGLFAATMGMLLIPKAYGLMALMLRPLPQDSPQIREQAWLSVLLETGIAILIAPIMMLLHSQFVLATLRGKKVKWNAQQRDDVGVSLTDALMMHWAHTLIGVATTLVLYFAAPSFLFWLSPVLVGLVFSVPLSMLLGSLEIGKKLKNEGLLLINEEVDAPEVLKVQRKALAKNFRDKQSGPKGELFELVLQDPAYLVLHLGILRTTDREIPIFRDQLLQIQAVVKRDGLQALPPNIRFQVQNNRYAMEQLHIQLRAERTPKSPLAYR
ncbi:glucans biosynthesis glucosyltransferase MdoH [Blastopirellula marina]|uniref:Glucans biosynthesis glucosyltransferase H n=1 Tax=Blastopirellula marina TaxID=124 RepID=A0A2S8GB76_9BACT|nr:glucans biosynthesis glucosyltransferase MdoH [Blastopirellula marina]PQO41669.1 glucans biosynthesis glucosyltransferase MdoH [Blastopirellula marina]PTL46112.1 glucans biosynthesis glucosyltransferase MdoH [Blastopirellula marina]